MANEVIPLLCARIFLMNLRKLTLLIKIVGLLKLVGELGQDRNSIGLVLVLVIVRFEHRAFNMNIWSILLIVYDCFLLYLDTIDDIFAIIRHWLWNLIFLEKSTVFFLVNDGSLLVKFRPHVLDGILLLLDLVVIADTVLSTLDIL